MKYFIYTFIFTLFTLIAFDLNAQERIRMIHEVGGTYTIPCEVNGLKLKFLFDTGASDVTLSLTEAAFMLKNGYLDSEDFIGTDQYQIANGEIEENMIINLKSLKIGSKTLTNIRASISSNLNAPLLLGQSALGKLGSYMIDGDYLIFNPRKFVASNSNSVNSYNDIHVARTI